MSTLSIDLIAREHIYGPKPVVSLNLDRFLAQVHKAGFTGIGILEDGEYTQAGPLDYRGTKNLDASVRVIRAATAAGLDVLYRWNGMFRRTFDQPFYYPPNVAAAHIGYAASLVSSPKVKIIDNDLEISKKVKRVPLAKIGDRAYVDSVTAAGDDLAIPVEDRGPVLGFWNLTREAVGSMSECEVWAQDLAMPMPGWEGKLGHDIYPASYVTLERDYGRYPFIVIPETAPVTQADVASLVAFAARRGAWANFFHLTAEEPKYWDAKKGFARYLVDGIAMGLSGLASRR